MSNSCNDKIYEAALERAEEEQIDVDLLFNLDLEEVFQYVTSGTLPAHI